MVVLLCAPPARDRALAVNRELTPVGVGIGQTDALLVDDGLEGEARANRCEDPRGIARRWCPGRRASALVHQHRLGRRVDAGLAGDLADRRRTEGRDPDLRARRRARRDPRPRPPPGPATNGTRSPSTPEVVDGRVGLSRASRIEEMQKHRLNQRGAPSSAPQPSPVFTERFGLRCRQRNRRSSCQKTPPTTASPVGANQCHEEHADRAADEGDACLRLDPHDAYSLVLHDVEIIPSLSSLGLRELFQGEGSQRG